MDDVLVFVPGMLGSCLERDGTPIWGGCGTVASLLGARALEVLPNERVVVSGLTGRVAQLPGLFRFAPHRPLIAHLRRQFELSDGVNFEVFPYDWRLSCAVNGELLAQRVAPMLEDRRRSHPDAALVFLCHSMGGLVVQHATDVVGLGLVTRRVLTLGTPFRGAAKALGVLWGVSTHIAAKLPFVRQRLSRMVRTFPSVYELLPRYRAIVGGPAARPIELGDLGPDGEEELFERSTAFHAALEAPRTRPYRRTVIVGSSQRTSQYARMSQGMVELLDDYDGMADRRGDGTVPRQSVPPAGWNDDADAVPLSQAHLGLPFAPSTYRILSNALTATPRDQQDAAMRAQLALEVPDLVLAGTPAALGCEVVAGDAGVPLVVTVQLAGSERPPRATTPKRRDGGLVATFDDLPPGDYMVSLGPAGPISGVASVHDAFTVVDPAVEQAAR